MVALLTECNMPKSSAWITSKRESAGYPNRAATVLSVRVAEAFGRACEIPGCPSASIALKISKATILIPFLFLPETEILRFRE
jgi:hypothetical protein